jgi:hypothetical protein
MSISRRTCGVCLLALFLSLALAGAGWSQTAPATAPAPANPYRQAVEHLEKAEQELTAGNASAALTEVKKSNEIFTRLQKESAAKLAERELSSQESQQLAINQKLATEVQGKADEFFKTAAAKKKEAADLRGKGQMEAADAAEGESRDQYLQARTLSIKSAIYALRNQQIIFRFLGS